MLCHPTFYSPSVSLLVLIHTFPHLWCSMIAPTMDAFMNHSMFSSIEFDDDVFDVFPTSSSDISLSTLTSDEDYHLDIRDPLEWIYEDDFHLPFDEQSCFKDMNPSEDLLVFPPLPCPGISMEVDQESSIFHLLKAYGEAMEKGFNDLSQVILTRLQEKGSPLGTTMERLSHYLVQQSDPHMEHLKQECLKNYALAFHAFYEITPYGRFAHFVANAAIQESLPRYIDSIHIVDFDVGDGIQWPPLLAALGPQRLVRITCIDPNSYRFVSLKQRLVYFAEAMGLNLRVDGMSLEELLIEKKTGAKGIGASEKEWLVFNCMVGLPHMGMVDSYKGSQVEEFMRVAQELVVSSTRCGILTYGNALSGFVPFSDGHLLHSHSLFESLEWHFESNLSLARTTMENLFVGRCISSCSGWLGESLIGSEFEGCEISKKNLLEAKEMGKMGNYSVKVTGDGGNEMVLEWRGTPIVRVSAWR